MGNVDQPLHGGFEGLILNFIDEQRDQNRQREEEYDVADSQPECVDEQCAKLAAVEEFGKVGEAHPLTAENPLRQPVIHERCHQAEHGAVLENKEIEQSGKQHQVQNPVFLHAGPKGQLADQRPLLAFLLRHRITPVKNRGKERSGSLNIVYLVKSFPKIDITAKWFSKGHKLTEQKVI